MLCMPKTHGAGAGAGAQAFCGRVVLLPSAATADMTPTAALTTPWPPTLCIQHVTYVHASVPKRALTQLNVRWTCIVAKIMVVCVGSSIDLCFACCVRDVLSTEPNACVHGVLPIAVLGVPVRLYDRKDYMLS